MTRLVLLIGLPGSGKSSLARHLLAEFPHSQIISTDAIRAKLFGDESVQGPWMAVWREAERQFYEGVARSPLTIYDATNTQRRNRREVIAFARNASFTRITGLWLNMPLEVCLQRNQQRRRNVPEDVIRRMDRQLTDAPPSLQEGFDSLLTSSPANRKAV